MANDKKGGGDQKAQRIGNIWVDLSWKATNPPPASFVLCWSFWKTLRPLSDKDCTVERTATALRTSVVIRLYRKPDGNRLTDGNEKKKIPKQERQDGRNVVSMKTGVAGCGCDLQRAAEWVIRRESILLLGVIGGQWPEVLNIYNQIPRDKWFRKLSTLDSIAAVTNYHQFNGLNKF